MRFDVRVLVVVVLLPSLSHSSFCANKITIVNINVFHNLLTRLLAAYLLLALGLSVGVPSFGAVHCEACLGDPQADQNPSQPLFWPLAAKPFLAIEEA